jgi:hypothetical protein
MVAAPLPRRVIPFTFSAAAGRPGRRETQDPRRGVALDLWAHTTEKKGGTIEAEVPAHEAASHRVTAAD